MKKILIAVLLIAFTSCSSDDDMGIQDFTSEEYMKNYLLGTWKAIEYKAENAGWQKHYDTRTYTFKDNGKYEHKIANFLGSHEEDGTYKFIPESGTLGAIIEVSRSGMSSPRRIRVLGYGGGEIEVSESGIASGTTHYRYKKIN